MAESQILVRLTIFRVDAQGGTRLGNRIGSVIQPVEQIGHRVVIFRKVGHQLQSRRKFVVCVVELIFLAQHHTQCEVQRGVIVISRGHSPQLGFGLMKALRSRVGGRL